MRPETPSARQARHLLQIGVAMFLFTSFWGFTIPYLGSQRIGLSVHTLSSFQGVLLLAIGLSWPQLALGRRASWIAFWCLLHGAFAILAAYVVAALWGVGNETIVLMGELPHGLSRGTALEEGLVKLLAYSSGPTGIASFALILWGLIAKAEPQHHPRPEGEFQ